MADLGLREKMKIIAQAAKHGENIPEGSKGAGLIAFLILFGCAIIVLFALAIGLMINGHRISAAVFFIIAVLLTYSIFKMMKADDIQHL
ncbi:hypothetical protein [Sporosarcina limicola]|uniref:Uncharacterized protein n=1 Tax=Sporosarcina limicola TaxID=34101 RepID=A0A927MKM3_9BACL|nr:hypothetical protein [Sporosarcina limicola]MBE1552941.1 hypothetical protein [Sporosarcina limicola]